MIFGQAGKLYDRRFLKGQCGNEVPGAPFRDEFVGRLRQGQFSELMLDNDLLSGSNAQVNFVIRIGV